MHWKLGCGSTTAMGGVPGVDPGFPIEVEEIAGAPALIGLSIPTQALFIPILQNQGVYGIQ